MAQAYTATLPNPPGVPGYILVRVYALRTDDKKLSAEDLEALARAYPPTDETSRAAVEASIARARAKASKRAKPSPSARSRAKTTAPKRKAAKKPTRTR